MGFDFDDCIHKKNTILVLRSYKYVVIFRGCWDEAYLVFEYHHLLHAAVCLASFEFLADPWFGFACVLFLSIGEGTDAVPTFGAAAGVGA